METIAHCHVQPTSSENVSKFIQAIKPSVLKGEAKFVIRDGGVFTPPDDEAGDGGFIVDLSNMNTTTLIPEGTAATGAGGRWDNVLADLARENVSVAGAAQWRDGYRKTCPRGRALILLAKQRGFVCNNMVKYEIVLASREIDKADANTNSDLWTALKGGSNNFGIVTRYDMEVFTQGLL